MIADLNPLLRGWAGYFGLGSGSQPSEWQVRKTDARAQLLVGDESVRYRNNNRQIFVDESSADHAAFPKVSVSVRTLSQLRTTKPCCSNRLRMRLASQPTMCA